MKTSVTFVVLLLAGLACSSPIFDDDTLTITEEFFPDELAIYTADNNIVKIITPINSLNFEDDDIENDISGEENLYIFFVQAEKDSQGKTVDKGLYVLKNGHASKLLDHGRDAAASSDDSKDVFFGASDGIYVYNVDKNKADKYGTVDEDIIAIEKENGTDVIYILTAAHKVFKVSNNGNTKERVTKVKNAIQIALDSSNNLYYVDSSNHVKALVNDEVVTIKGLPQNPSYIQLIRPPFVMEDSIPLVAGKKAFTAYANGTSEFGDMVLNSRPTAYSMEATLIQYYARNKKIYEYNILAIVMGSLLEEMKSFLEDKTDQIQTIATQTRKTFKA